MLVLQNNINYDNYDNIINKVINFLLKYFEKNVEVLVRLVDSHEITELNKNFRNKNKPTNVLSFPNTAPAEIDNSLGDIIICLDVVKHEAKKQNKTIANHMTHIIIHGFLHLLGYDHIHINDAEIMENLEIKILKKFNIQNPYL